MTELSWRPIKTYKLEMKPGPLWRRAVDYVQGPRLLRIQVQEKDEKNDPVVPLWGKAGVQCSPDGCPGNDPPKTALLCATAPRGALIGKLGGSSADQPDTTPNTPPYGTKKVFAIGSYCVFVMAKEDSGPLFLTRNDTCDAFGEQLGELAVLIEEVMV